LAEREREYAIKDAMIMATTLALAAQSKGYSTCYINGWDESKVKEIIGVEGDKNIAIALVLPVGLPNSEAKHPGRLPAAKTIFTDRIPSPAI
jgi:nitroreductase